MKQVRLPLRHLASWGIRSTNWVSRVLGVGSVGGGALPKVAGVAPRRKKPLNELGVAGAFGNICS